MPIAGMSGTLGVGRPFGSEPPKRLAVEVPTANPSRQDVARALFQQFGFTEKDADYLARNFNGRDPVAAFADSLQLDERSISAADGKTRVTIELSARDFATLEKLAARRPSATPSAAPPTDASEAAQARRGYDHGANLRERLNRQMDAAAPKPKPPEPAPNQEGLGSFLEGAIAGDFSENDSWSATAGKIVGGLNPLADARDIVAGVKHVAEGKDGAWIDLGTATLGAIPLVGDAGKALIRGGRKVAKEAVEEGAEALTKEAAEATAKKAVQESAPVVTKEALEKVAKQKAAQLEAADGGHSVARHGPEVSDADLQRRLTTGVAPDGKISFAPASTKFNSYESWLKTRDVAMKQMEQKYGIDLSKAPPSGTSGPFEIRVGFDKPIDDGFVPDKTTATKIKVEVDGTGKPSSTPTGVFKQGKVFSASTSIDGVTGTYTKIDWDGQKWRVIQHFPLAEGWNNAAKAYTDPGFLDVKTSLP